ncbi:hypothetical protein CTI12_AA102890 [Artemisia annua]|uniref:Helitron helicase-like domain-containing protein n=1 Tax=Artemisia annua TaxID=35608 RepID=A0A2U1PX39_ARTAN|nr:hypothetical protein CTI12_AA102890 [Artemisia annua]
MKTKSKAVRRAIRGRPLEGVESVSTVADAGLSCASSCPTAFDHGNYPGDQPAFHVSMDMDASLGSNNDHSRGSLSRFSGMDTPVIVSDNNTIRPVHPFVDVSTSLGYPAGFSQGCVTTAASSYGVPRCSSDTPTDVVDVKFTFTIVFVVDMGSVAGFPSRLCTGITINEPDPEQSLSRIRARETVPSADVNRKGKRKVDDIPTSTGSYGVPQRSSDGPTAAQCNVDVISVSSDGVVADTGVGSSARLPVNVNGHEIRVLRFGVSLFYGAIPAVNTDYCGIAPPHPFSMYQCRLRVYLWQPCILLLASDTCSCYDLILTGQSSGPANGSSCTNAQFHHDVGAAVTAGTSVRNAVPAAGRASASCRQPTRNATRRRPAPMNMGDPVHVQHNRGAPDTYVSLGPCNRICRHCKAMFWFEERLKHGSVRFPEYHRCCMGGKVILRPQPEYPPYIRQLFTDQNLIQVLDEHNELVRLFRTARDRLAVANIPEFQIRLFGVAGSRQYDLPSGDSLGAIVYEGGPDTGTEYDVVIQKVAGDPERVNKFHPCYMSLQFPLLFIFGEDGFHLGLRLWDVTSRTLDEDKKMSMKMKMSSNTTIANIAKSVGKRPITELETVGIANLRPSDISKAVHVKVYRN